MSSRPAGHTAVMAQRAPTPPDSLDYFPTPPWAARAGGELITRLDPAAISCWEPACGEGHMAHGLAEYFARVGCSDIYPYGRGSVFDFLAGDGTGGGQLGLQDTPEVARAHWDWVVSNPPFNHAMAFVEAALPRARRGVAMLLRLAFREGGEQCGRHEFFCRTPATVVAQFAERVPMHRGRWLPKGSTATAYAWFIWLKPASNSPLIALAEEARRLTGDPAAAIDLLIPPDAKARLHRSADVVKFGARTDAPMEGEETE
jgi:hypothetical protein